MAEKKEKATAIIGAASFIKKKFGRSIEPAGTKYDEVPKSISTGSRLLDNAIGACNGYPFGSCIEVFGWEGAGKTLMLYLAIAEAQRKYPDKPCVLIDAERQFRFQAAWARQVGVNVEKLIVLPCSTAEECFDMITALILGEHEVDKKTGEVVRVMNPGNYAIIGVDSVTQLVSLVDASKDMDESRQRGSQASAIGLGLKKVTSAMARSDVDSQTILFFINQLRKNPNTGFGKKNPDYRTGGNALPFYDTLALKVDRVWKSEERDDNGDIISHGVKIVFHKNKAGSMPEDAIVFTLMHDGSGVDNDREFFDVALLNGILREFEVEVTKGKDKGKFKTRYNFFNPETDEKFDDSIKDFAMKKKFNEIVESRPDIKELIEECIKEKKIFVDKDSIKEYVPDYEGDSNNVKDDEPEVEEDDDVSAFTDDNKEESEKPADEKKDKKKSGKKKMRMTIKKKK